MAELTATLQRVFWSSSDDPPRTVVASIAIPRDQLNGAAEYMRDDGTAVIKGRDDATDLVPGLPYKFVGSWERHHRHGWQFSFKQFLKAEPHDRFGLVHYLQRHARGIGPTLAARLWDAFGTDAVKVLRTDPTRAAEAAKGLKLEVAEEAAADLRALQELEDTKIELTNLFAGRGFPHALIDRVIKKWGLLATLRIRRDPFTLLVHRMAGCGFNRCDRLYLDLGHSPARLKRQMLCIWHHLRSDTSGHTWFSVADVQRALNQGVSGAKVEPRRAVELGLRSGWLAKYRDGEGKLWIAERRKADNERLLAEQVKALSGWVPLQRESERESGSGSRERSTPSTVESLPSEQR